MLVFLKQQQKNESERYKRYKSKVNFKLYVSEISFALGTITNPNILGASCN